MKEGTFSIVYLHLSEKYVKSLVFCPTDLKGHLGTEHRECLSAASLKFQLLINRHVVLFWCKNKPVCFNVTEQRFISCLKYVYPQMTEDRKMFSLLFLNGL